MKNIKKQINEILYKFDLRFSKIIKMPKDINYKFHVENDINKAFKIQPEIIEQIFAFYDNIDPFYEGMNIRKELKIGRGWTHILKESRKNQIELIKNSDKAGYSKLLENMFFNEIVTGLWNYNYFNKSLFSTRLPNQFLEVCNLFEKVTSTSLKTIASDNVWHIWGAKTENGVIPYNSPDHSLQAFNIINLLSFIDDSDRIFNVLDLGSGYGGMCEKLLNPYFKKNKVISVFLIDVPLNLTTAYAYLAQRFGVEKIKLIKDRSETKQIKPEDGRIWLIPTIYLEDLKVKIDVVNNSQSLSEMDEENIKYYIDLLLKDTTTFFIETNVNDVNTSIKHGDYREIYSRNFPIPNSHRLFAKFSAPEFSSRYVTSIYGLKSFLGKT